MKRNVRPNNDGGIIFGFIILAVGVLILLKKLDVFYPDWLLSWPMILIAIGVITLVKHEFKSFFGVVMLSLGAYFLLEREFGLDFGIQRFIFPIALIGLGIYLITQKRKEQQVMNDIQDQIRSKSKVGASSGSSYASSSSSEDNESVGATYNQSGQNKSYSGMSGVSGTSFSDSVSIDSIMSGINKRMLTKNFQGGKLTAAFGGIDLDLTQTDFTGMVTLQVDVIFGGIKLVVPPHWDVRVEVTNIAAGVEDKRVYRQTEVDSDKVMVIKGTVFFGGLEIKSY
ncbi:cell wall-active antibiotics response protein [Algoriphagus halophytocola]|uniref:Cell wall-active antibiotics response protein n=1 Tax=Algoriphagus halophytocola TaxID=2991499 RepID=A0ABY6MN50_9BACT|nr:MULTISPECIES: cell wall-active antibiotics response protein [unclassified Algoriphagus]UZD24568.1 cell wall-active antibiotics response protein [Algoriphagus sp. TR-M5]WBL41933.1 cell wall-active antibiotics response protein [Algoriphagus sp. TR-M9]